MKNLLLILSITLLFSSCLYTKKTAIDKFCKQDSVVVSVLVHDTFYVKEISVDTFFKASIDSFTIIKDRLEIRYKKVGEKIFIQGNCKGDTIYKTKFVNIQLPILKPKLAWYESFYIKVRDWFAVIGLIAILIGLGLLFPIKKT